MINVYFNWIPRKLYNLMKSDFPEKICLKIKHPMFLTVKCTISLRSSKFGAQSMVILFDILF